MKRLLLPLIIVACSIVSYSQQKIISQAIVKSKTEIVFPENTNRGSDGDGDGSGFGGGPRTMESKTTIYFKGDLVKTYNETDFGNNTVIIDKKNKKTTTLIEAMGKKTGFYTTEEDEAEMRKNMERRMDSIRQARGQSAANQNNNTPRDVEVTTTDETKKIAGYLCKKAIVKTKTRGETNESIVWYTPDFKMTQGYPTGNTGSGFGGGRGMRMGGGLGNVSAITEKIDGFIMGYEISRPNGFKMTMEVTKAEPGADISDNTFDIPKGYEIKSAKDMQNQFLPGRGLRPDNNN